MIDINFPLINTPNIHEFKLGFGGFGLGYWRMQFDDLRGDFLLEFDEFGMVGLLIECVFEICEYVRVPRHEHGVDFFG